MYKGQVDAPFQHWGVLTQTSEAALGIRFPQDAVKACSIGLLQLHQPANSEVKD